MRAPKRDDYDCIVMVIDAVVRMGSCLWKQDAAHAVAWAKLVERARRRSATKQPQNVSDLGNEEFGCRRPVVAPPDIDPAEVALRPAREPDDGHDAWPRSWAKTYSASTVSPR